MIATAWVEPDIDTLVVDVTGANPGETETVQLKGCGRRAPRVRQPKAV